MTEPGRAELGGTGGITVRVPATSANLGPGYDCFGLALARYDEVRATRTDGPLRIEVSGVGADSVPRTSDHLVVRAAAAGFAALEETMPGLALRCTNTIPHGGGQGSSAAAIVAGLLVARGLTADGETRLPDPDLLALASQLEGHPDNVAPALLGGFTVAWTPADGRARAVRRVVHPEVHAVMFGAQQSSSTAAARAALPPTVPHADAAANVASAALLVHALTEDPSLLFEATVDRLHQPYRASSMAQSAALVAELRAAGIAAVVSGAGPSVLALTTGSLALNAWRRPGFDVAELAVAAAGATVEQG